MSFLVPNDLNLWLNVVKLYGWLMSGVITAVLVIVINEGIAWRKRRRYQKNLLMLLICELASNLKLIHTYFYELSDSNVIFSNTIWINSSNEVARILPKDVLCELFALYHKFHYLELFPNTTTQNDLSAIESSVLRVQKQLAKIAQIPR